MRSNSARALVKDRKIGKGRDGRRKGRGKRRINEKEDEEED